MSDIYKKGYMKAYSRTLLVLTYLKTSFLNHRKILEPDPFIFVCPME